MSVGIKYTGFISSPIPLQNNPECDVTINMFGGQSDLSLNKSTSISANNISLGKYRDSFTIPVKQIISNYNTFKINYFYAGDIIDWDPSSIEVTKTDSNTSEIAVGTSSFTLPYTISNTDIGQIGSLLFNFNNIRGFQLQITTFDNDFFFVVEPEYIDILIKVNNANQNIALSVQTIKAQNTLIKTLKAAGIWNKLDVLYIFGLGNPTQNDSSYNYLRTINWKNPDLYQANLINSFDLDFRGVRPISCSSFSYIDTNFIPSINGVNYTLNNSSRYIVRFAASTGPIDGTLTSNNNTISTTITSSIHRINSTNNLNSAFSFGNNIYSSINRLSSTSVKISSDNTITNRTQTSTGLPTESQLILRNASSFGCHGITVYAMGAALSDAEIISFNTAISIYLSNF